MTTLPVPGEHHDIAPTVAGPPSRRRRPSGEPPPLPWHVDPATAGQLVLLGVVAAGTAAMTARPVLAAVTRTDLMFVHAAAAARTDAATRLFADVHALTSPTPLRAVAVGTVVILAVTRHLRHLASYIAIALGTAFVAASASLFVGRMRPAGVVIVGNWTGYGYPSPRLTASAIALSGVVYTLVPRSRRRRAAQIAFAVLAVVGVSEIYLGVSHPSDALAAFAVGWCLPAVCYRFAVPDEAFPVTYRRGRPAHLDLDPVRTAAISRAFGQQLGLRVVAIEPFGLAGSAGSTPIRLRVADLDGDGSSEDWVFAKLYTLSHLRSDRSYKFARTILYGRLEDEKPFSTVRRLVEYEDHLLRLLRDSQLPTPRPYGVVEITPEREYLIVMEFFESAHEITHEALGDAEIDDGLRVVRQLWDAGVAHRDIKPSNVLIRDGRVLLIDVAFAALRPTPWRQAVDLANMMLTLALVSSAENVYARAARVFAPEDIAEAFAASRAITIPNQLRRLLRADGRDLVREFRRLAPDRPRVSIQLWTVRRVALTAAAAVAASVAAAVIVSAFRLPGLL